MFRTIRRLPAVDSRNAEHHGLIRTREAVGHRRDPIIRQIRERFTASIGGPGGPRNRYLSRRRPPPTSIKWDGTS
jgi:hypothetical protein